jgi:hypothetical protein
MQISIMQTVSSKIFNISISILQHGKFNIDLSERKLYKIVAYLMNLKIAFHVSLFSHIIFEFSRR